jgi:predicted 3-demethylubiquinone-9 3-methyltransferase (glyoxalase superfamily)
VKLTYGREQAMQKIRPYLWFDNQAEEAANHYVSVFKNSKITDVQRYGDVGPGTPGAVMIIGFELDGQEFVALNGGPQFKFTEATSFYVNCETQEEVDELWDRLCDGGEPGQCGWLKDRYGVSWQIIPKQLAELLQQPDPEKAGRVMQAMLSMQKIDVQGLKDAAK